MIALVAVGIPAAGQLNYARAEQKNTDSAACKVDKARQVLHNVEVGAHNAKPRTYKTQAGVDQFIAEGALLNSEGAQIDAQGERDCTVWVATQPSPAATPAKPVTGSSPKPDTKPTLPPTQATDPNSAQAPPAAKPAGPVPAKGGATDPSGPDAATKQAAQSLADFPKPAEEVTPDTDIAIATGSTISDLHSWTPGLTEQMVKSSNPATRPCDKVVDPASYEETRSPLRTKTQIDGLEKAYDLLRNRDGAVIDLPGRGKRIKLNQRLEDQNLNSRSIVTLFGKSVLLNGPLDAKGRASFGLGYITPGGRNKGSKPTKSVPVNGIPKREKGAKPAPGSQKYEKSHLLAGCSVVQAIYRRTWRQGCRERTAGG